MYEFTYFFIISHTLINGNTIEYFKLTKCPAKSLLLSLYHLTLVNTFCKALDLLWLHIFYIQTITFFDVIEVVCEATPFGESFHERDEGYYVNIVHN